MGIFKKLFSNLKSKSASQPAEMPAENPTVEQVKAIPEAPKAIHTNAYFVAHMEPSARFGDDDVIDVSQGMVFTKNYVIPDNIPGSPRTEYSFITGYRFAQNAFRNHTEVESITICNKDYQLADDPFLGCTNLKEIRFSNARNAIIKVDHGMPSLKSIVFDDNVKWIQISISGCPELEEIRFPEKIERIDVKIKKCPQLTKIQLPGLFEEELKKERSPYEHWLYNLNITGCPSITEVTITGSIICGELTFSDALKSFRAVDSIQGLNTNRPIPVPQDFGGNEFLMNGSLLLRYLGHAEKLVIPDGVTGIAGHAFANNTDLKYLVTPDSLWFIGNCAFKDCQQLRTVETLAKQMHIGISSFEGCTALEHVDFQESVQCLKERAFDNCPSLQTLYFHKDLARYTPRTARHSKNLTALIPVVDSQDAPWRENDLFCKTFLPAETLFLVYKGSNGEKACVKYGYQYRYAEDENLDWRTGEDAQDNEEDGKIWGIEPTEDTIQQIKDQTAIQEVKTDGVEPLISEKQKEKEQTDSGLAEVEIAPETAVQDKAVTSTQMVQTQSIASGTDSSSRPHIKEEKIAKAVDQMIDKLEAYFPEHKIFALDSIDGSLRDNLANLYKLAGYATVNDMFTAYGFEVVSGDAVKQLRNFVMYTPGNEPDCIKPKVDNALSLLNKYYPDHVISRGFQKDHKSLAKTMSGLYQWLGYEDVGAMLTAYGYEYSAESSVSNRSAYTYEPPKEAEATDSKYFKYSTDRKGNATILGLNRDMGTIAVPSVMIIPYAIDGHIVTAIGKGAFQGEGQITEVKMPDSVTLLRGEAFKDCVSLKKIQMSNGISKLVKTTFEGCAELEEINIPDLVSEIGAGAFSSCPLKKIHMGKNLQKISPIAFVYYPSDYSLRNNQPRHSIEEITLDPENEYLKVMDMALLSADGKTMFAYLGHDSYYKIPDGIEAIGYDAFNGLDFLTDVVLPDSLETIGAGAFYCTSLTSVVLGPNVKSIASYAFDGCQSLTSVVFNDKIERIENGAFRGCKITSVRLPATLEYLGTDNFDGISYDAKSKNEIVIDPKNPYLLADDNALYSLAPEGKTLRYLFKECGEEESYCVQPNTIHIADKSCRNSSLKKITLPDGLLTIGAFAFDNCKNLQEMSIPDSVEYIGKWAFYDTGIKKISIGASLKDIDEEAFANGDYLNCGKLHQIKVHKSNSKFYVNDKILYKRKEDGTSAVVQYFGGPASIALQDDVSEIFNSAFTNRRIREIQLPSSIKKIGEKAFFGCNKLSKISVSYETVDGGKSFAEVYIPVDSYSGEYIKCIRTDCSRGLFDFVKYDGLFNTLYSMDDKIKIATGRLKSAIELAPHYREQYLSFLREHSEYAVYMLIRNDDVSGLNTLADLEVLTENDINCAIKQTSMLGKDEFLNCLTKYKK